jgi:hypothetical protein
MKVLWVHATPLSQLGGAELSISSRIANAPSGISIDLVSPEATPNLESYDALVLSNLRPSGGVGESGEVRWVEKWIESIQRFRGFSLKVEHDIHPCSHRDARCISFRPIRKLPCECGPLIPQRMQALYNRCDAVQFLSPAHQSVVNCLVKIKSEQYTIAPPIDLDQFRVTTPLEDRKAAALILGDGIRVADSAERRAREFGFHPERVDYLSVPYSAMPDLYNRYQAVVVDPFMFHAFGRVAVEAKACGCRVITSARVGAFSWEDPIEACRRSNRDFWTLLLRHNHGRWNRLKRFWRQLF